MKILITGSAGFIGYHTSVEFLKQRNNLVVGVDNVNSYYDIKLKKKRLKKLQQFKNFKFIKLNLKNFSNLEKIFKIYRFDIVVNLAAQAGVRHSIKNAKDYLDSNLIGFFNIIELSKKYKIKKFMFASTSSVYGDTDKHPFKESLAANHPIQFYAATKKSNEIIAHSYSSMFNMQCIGMRFFTVYGPWGRPDMVLFKFVKNILKNKPIELYNNGKHERDFTYVEDVACIIYKLSQIKLYKTSKQNFNDSSSSKSRFEIFNISSGKKVKLKRFLSIIEKKLNKKAKIKLLPLQRGDVVKSLSSRKKLSKFINLKKAVKVEEGVKNFINWYTENYR